MASSIRPANRYSNNSLNSSTKSDPSSSSEFSSSRAVAKRNDAASTHMNFSSMVKKLVDNKKAKNLNREVPKLVVAADFLAQDLKKPLKKGTGGLSGLHKKLFNKGSSSSGAKRGDESSKKALTEVKGNTRTLAMVLRSERELLSSNKEQEEQIVELKIVLEEKNREVEKLKDLCLKQREEIKCLKSAILFPDVMNSQLQDLLEKQNSELKQAKQLIPSLQRQVSSLTGQLQYLADDLAEVKAEKYSGRRFSDNHFSSPRTPSYEQEDAADSLVVFSQFDQDFSSGDYATPESPDEMFVKDLNPCLTPYYVKTKSKEFDPYDSPDDGRLSRGNMQASRNTSISTKISRNSDSCKSSKEGDDVIVCAARRSDQAKLKHGKQMNHKLFQFSRLHCMI
ncbi:hypothetical protein ACJIZ3_006733 [Penstemon smallii]|uniref:Uncharacterized protein n=1 Tax=Penstemon smallii TaxID=265156 RepID=A0ABD3S922_9LAMI